MRLKIMRKNNIEKRFLVTDICTAESHLKNSFILQGKLCLWYKLTTLIGVCLVGFHIPEIKSFQVILSFFKKEFVQIPK